MLAGDLVAPAACRDEKSKPNPEKRVDPAGDSILVDYKKLIEVFPKLEPKQPSSGDAPAGASPSRLR
jgi:hypothetical protein